MVPILQYLQERQGHSEGACLSHSEIIVDVIDNLRTDTIFSSKHNGSI